MSEIPNDCESIIVTPVAGGGATVELTTRDGRTAERRIASVSELAPLVRALLVASPSPSPSPSSSPDPKPAPPEPAAIEPAPSGPSPGATPALAPTADTAAPVRGAPKRFAVAASAGLSLPAADTAAPMGQIAVSFVPSRWEVGAFGRWVFEHELTEGGEGHSSLASIGGGATIGRRETLGPTWFIFGAAAGVYDLEEERRRHHAAITPGVRHVDDSFIEPRLGAYVGSVYPVTQRFRVRAQLDGEAALASHTPASALLPATPSWGLGLTFGVEAGL